MSNGDATPTGIPSSDFQSPNSEMKWTPLQLACITRDHGGASAGGGGGGLGSGGVGGSALPTPFSFEIHSPNRKHSLLLREVDLTRGTSSFRITKESSQGR